jgi:hypothetical protein
MDIGAYRPDRAVIPSTIYARQRVRSANCVPGIARAASATVSIRFSGYAGMDVGRDNGGVVDLSYSDRGPFPFTGTIKKVVFDVKPHLAQEDEQAVHLAGLEGELSVEQTDYMVREGAAGLGAVGSSWACAPHPSAPPQRSGPSHVP